MLPKMKEELTNMMDQWKLQEYGINSFSKLKSKMVLDYVHISRYSYGGGGYSLTIGYNNDPKHMSKEFFEHHSFFATIYIFDSGKREYDFSL